MLHGWVTRAWLVKQHPKWLREMEEAGKLEVCGQPKGKTHGH
jgi:formate dehydrogenase subunit gamma